MTWEDWPGTVANWPLAFWDSPEWVDVQEKLDAVENSGYLINPSREYLFRSLDNLEPDQVKCCIVGQDPYPDHSLATGLAFSVPATAVIPQSLRVVFQEYVDDLSLPYPSHGDLSDWSSRGVLLWNAIPSCTFGKSLSHNWPSWWRLTNDIIECLAQRGVVFVLVGAHARRHYETICYHDLVNPGKSRCIVVSHPSPRGSPRRSGHSNWPQAFRGSRIFSKTNDYLVQLGREPVDWRLG